MSRPIQRISFLFFRPDLSAYYWITDYVYRTSQGNSSPCFFLLGSPTFKNFFFFFFSSTEFVGDTLARPVEVTVPTDVRHHSASIASRRWSTAADRKRIVPKCAAFFRPQLNNSVLETCINVDMLLLFFVCLFFFGSSLPLFFDKQKMPFHPARTRIHLVDLFRLRLVHQREIRSADLVPNNKKKKGPDGNQTCSERKKQQRGREMKSIS